MPQHSLLRRTLLAHPLSLARALEILADSKSLPASMLPAVKSTAIDAVRQALRRGDELPSRDEAISADIRDIIPILHVAARQAAERKGHQEAGDHERRAHRFTQALTGRRFDVARLDYPCPATWMPLVNAIKSDTPNANGEIGFVARCCRILGFADAPRVLPLPESLVAAAEQLLFHRGTPEIARERVRNALTIYRRARAALIASAPEHQRADIEGRFAPMPNGVSARTSHLGVERATYEALRRDGLVPEAMNAHEMFRAIAPELAEDYEFFVRRTALELSDSYHDTCERTLLRMAGWMIRAGRIEQLRTMHLDDFFAVAVEIEAAPELNPRIAKRRGIQPGQLVRKSVSLLDYLAEREAEASLKRSTVTGSLAEDDGRDDDGRPYFTSAIWADCGRLWEMTEAVYGEMANDEGEDGRRWALVTARWGVLQAKLSGRQLPAELRMTAKDKLRMIKTVTLPQLICVGLPLRRRELREMRKVWLDAIETARRAGHADPDSHPATLEAARAYFSQLLRFLVLVLALDDGMRRQQYVNGRLGDSANFRVTFVRDESGRPCGIKGLTTFWSGDRRDPAHLKIREKDREIVRREGREVRPGVVDFEFLWDLVSWWRPRQLLACGAIDSLDSYDLEADLREGAFALFPSRSSQVVALHRPRTDLSELAGQELHHIARAYLRPDLPRWEALGKEWRSLWAMHITRLLVSSYWGGALGDWKHAKYLTMDEEETLRAKYTKLDEGLQDYLTLDHGDWRHLNAYDPWMKRLCRGREVFDPLEDPNLPLPDHLREKLARERIAKRGNDRPARGRKRIRRARPGQRVPVVAEE